MLVYFFTLVTYFISRVAFLSALPVFNDESIYLDWGYRSINTSSGAFYSLYDAKQPLLLWLFGISQKFFSDPILAGRLVSVLFGLGSVIILFLLSKELFTNRRYHIAPYVYIVLPLFLFFDRQALMESAIFFIGLVTYCFFKKLINIQNKKNWYLYAIGLGLSVGIGYFIKSSSMIFVFGLVPVMIVFARKNSEEENYQLYKRLLLAIVVSLLVVTPLFKQNQFWETFVSNQRFALTPKEIFQFPLQIWLHNISTLLGVLILYVSPFFLLYILLPFFSQKKISKKLQYFFLYALTVIFVSIFITRSFNVRYSVPILIGVPFFVEHVYWTYCKNIWKKFLFITSFLPAILLSVLLIGNYNMYFSLLTKVPVLNRFSQYEEYLANWTSGIAVEKAISYINNEFKNDNQPVYIGLRTDAGNPENAVFVEYYTNEQVIVSYFDSGAIANIDEYDCLETDSNLLFISRDLQFGGTQRFWKEITRFYNDAEQSFVAIHTPKENCDGRKLKIN